MWETQKALDELLFKHRLQVSRALDGQGPRVALLGGGHLPSWKVKPGRGWTQCCLKRGPCRCPGEESAAAARRCSGDALLHR